jgi:purine-binding chemotaxis protein CheW
MDGFKGQDKSLGELLIQAGFITKEQLDEALKEQKGSQSQEPLGKILVRHRYVKEENIINVLKGLLVVVIEVNHELFGMEIVYSREILKNRRITRLPNLPDYIMGMISVRDQVIPVISLSKKIFGVEGVATPETRLIIIEFKENVLGFMVDRVVSVKNFQSSSFANITKYSFNVDKKYIAGLIKDGADVITLIKPDIFFDGKA